MFDYALAHLHPDQVKIYPCTTMPFTRILEDYKAGKYVPYSNEDLIDVVLYWKDRVHPWIRNNRIVRDIPDSYIVAGVKTSNQRLEFQTIHKERGGVCRCIRCREAGRFPDADPASGKLTTRVFEAQGAREIFLSWESTDEKVLFGFLRLRLPSLENPQTPSSIVFPELRHTALIRELHVYGRTFAVGATATSASVGSVGVAQHLGIGRRLLRSAEEIAQNAGFNRIAVISGVGVRRYYESAGYLFESAGIGEFMIKQLPIFQQKIAFMVIAFIVLVFSLLIGFYLSKKQLVLLRKN
jgi:ELP3 family radical SAM enzyme/protein acetyltransferase